VELPPAGPRKLSDGDVVSAEVFSNLGGRHTQHQITIAIGDPHPDLLRAAEVARATYDAGLAALRPGRAFDSVVDAMREVLDRADGWEFGPSLHALNPMIALSGFPADATKHIPGVDVYPPEPDHPTIGADMMLKPGMTFAMEPNYVLGRHLAYVGGTVIVGDPAPWNSTPTRPKFCAPKAKAGSDDRVHRKETV
jgi:Xaa-Pro aminopeptidase